MPHRSPEEKKQIKKEAEERMTTYNPVGPPRYGIGYYIKEYIRTIRTKERLQKQLGKK